MLDKVKGIEERYSELERQLSDPATMANSREFARLAKERSQLQEIVESIREYRRVENELADYKSALESNDADLRELAKEELPGLREKLAEVESRLKVLMTPRDPNDERDVILEIRAGTGGEEASLFAADLFRMYTRYAEVHGWKVEVLSMSTTGLGGIKEVVASIAGHAAYSRLKFEGGSASGAAGSSDRSVRTDPYLGSDGGGAARGRRSRDRHQRGKRPADRRDARFRSGRTER